MTGILSARLAAAASFLCLGWFAYTQTQPPQLTINKVKDNLYEIEGDGGNVAALITNEGVLLVDDKFGQDHDAILADIKTLTSAPIKYIITTANARANILNRKQPNAPEGMVPARLVFTQEMSVFIGGEEVRAEYFGRGHTNGDAIVYLPGLHTIHTGDLMAG